MTTIPHMLHQNNNDNSNMSHSFKLNKREEERKLFSPKYNDYQTPTSNNEDNNYDSWISLRPICLNNSSSEVLVASNTTRFEAPEISSMKTFAKPEEKYPQMSLSVNPNNRHMKKSTNIHHEIIGKQTLNSIAKLYWFESWGLENIIS